MMVTSIIPVAAESCDCVIFRFVDVQDFYLTAPRVDVMNTFIDQNEKVSLSILLNSVGADAAIVNKVAQGQQSGHFELTLHGFNHEDFTGFDFEGQKNIMELSQAKMNDTWGLNSSSFVPPMHQFNDDILQVMRDLDISIISSGPQGIDPPENIKFIADSTSHITDRFGNYHFPQTAEAYDHGTFPHTKISHADIMAAVDAAILQYGYSVLNLYGTDFANKDGSGNALETTNSTEINDLIAIINATRDKGYTITTFEETIQSASPPTLASLTVIKDVVNDNSGTNNPGDFIMVITANNPSSNNFAGSNSPGTTVTIDPGSFSFSEIGPEGYFATFSSECSGFAIAGESFTCTITNDDIAPPTASLTVIKNVINDNTGTNDPGDFAMVITATNPSDNNFAGVSGAGTTITIDPGSYSVDETGPGGYGKTLSSECSGTAVAGVSYTCTITNDDGFCDIPGSGDWTITENCILETSSSAPANVIVQNNSILTISSGVSLDIDFSQFNLTVEFGSGVLIKSGGIVT